MGGGDLPVARGWNTNWTSLNYQNVSDVTFIAAMVDTVISWMEDRLSDAGIVYSGRRWMWIDGFCSGIR